MLGGPNIGSRTMKPPRQCRGELLSAESHHRVVYDIALFRKSIIEVLCYLVCLAGHGRDHPSNALIYVLSRKNG
jgi:hypothetical protein